MKKIWLSFLYSCQGVKAALLNESSFRLEIVAMPFLATAIAFLNVASVRKLIMFSVYLLIPCLELINSSIEKLSDRLITEHDPKIQFVKDAASAAVMFAILIVLLIWIACICL